MLICQGYISHICDAYEKVNKIINGMKKFVKETLYPLPTRKDQALKVISAYGPTNRSAMVFSLLDQNSLNEDQLKKLLYQCLK